MAKTDNKYQEILVTLRGPIYKGVVGGIIRWNSILDVTFY